MAGDTVLLATRAAKIVGWAASTGFF